MRRQVRSKVSADRAEVYGPGPGWRCGNVHDTGKRSYGGDVVWKKSTEVKTLPGGRKGGVV